MQQQHHLQLQPLLRVRGLADRHGQLHQLLQRAGPRGALALRRDLLPPPHRPPHRRLHRGAAGVPAVAAVPGRDERGGLPVRRQLRGGERDGAEQAVLREEAPQRLRDHALLPRRPDPMVQASARHAPRLHRSRASGDHGELAVPSGDRRQRLHPPLVPEQHAGLGEAPGAPRHRLHRIGPGGAHPARRHDGVRAGRLPAGLLPAAPLPLPRRQHRRRLRPRHRLPPVAERPHRPPQQPPPREARPAPPRPPGRLPRLRRLLRQDHGRRRLPGGGPYNGNFTVHCSEPGAVLCPDPSVYVSWDGLHFTEAMYKIMARDLFPNVLLLRLRSAQ